MKLTPMLGRFPLERNSPEKVFTRVIENENGCLIWQGNTTPGGYGLMRLCGKYLGAHRIAYTCTRGDIPEELQVDHLCCVKNCVNPFHMELVTPAENLLRVFKRSNTCKLKKHVKNIGNTICAECRRLNRVRYCSKPEHKAYQAKWHREFRKKQKEITHAATDATK